VFEDDSQGGQAYRSTTPVRMIMGFDGVSTNATSATLSVGQDRVQNVPIPAQQNCIGGSRAPTAGGNRGPGQARNQGQCAEASFASETAITRLS
jgi:hypothetical protein